MSGKSNPGALAGATGVGLTFKAALNVFPIHSSIDGEMHHALLLERLRIRHGIKGPLASTIALLAYGGRR